jgi:hypothetical protein
LVNPLVRGLRYTVYVRKEREEHNMEKLNLLWTQYATARNKKVGFILLTLVAMAVAAGAPGAGSGII